MKKILLRLVGAVVVAFVCSTVIFADPPTFADALIELNDGDTFVIPSGVNSLTADKVISLPGFGVSAVVKIGADLDSGVVTIQPGAGIDSILLFDVVSAGSVLEVQLLNDLIFQGNAAKPMFIGVRGKGEVRVRMPFGKNITLRSTDSTTAGAHLRILMEQNKAQMEQSSQLCFESWSNGVDEINTNNGLHSVIEIGQNSSLSFVSQHKSGLVDGSGSLDYGYGSLAFDPSNDGTGRMILKIASGAAAADFHDGSVMIYGSYVLGSGISATDVQTADLRSNVYYKYRAGIGATMRVVDNVTRAQYEDAALTAYSINSNNSRGLVVFNYNNSFPRLANNYDQTVVIADDNALGETIGLTSSKWFVANTVQTGFVLGNNGILEVENNRFLDYFACRVNTALANFPKDNVHVAADATLQNGSHSPSHVKKHNPSALIVDGNAFRKTGTTARADSLFEYDAQDIAQILLQGNAGIFARVAADNTSGVMTHVTMDNVATQAADLTLAHINGTIGFAQYDGSSVIMRDNNNNPSALISPLGEIAIDIEGQLHVKSIASSDGAVIPSGFINMPTLLIDYHGKEVCITTGSMNEVGNRPLALNSSYYYRYNNSTMLVNDAVTFQNVRLIHNDVGRDISAIGTGDAIPAIIGGELPSLIIAKKLVENPNSWILDYTGSPLYLENSSIECHESMVSAGVRWVVRDLVIDPDTGVLADGDNRSFITLYNRGHLYDLNLNGTGRYFQLGSRVNTMADGVTINPLMLSDGTYPQSSLRDAFIDVYRQRPIPAEFIVTEEETNVIKLTVDCDWEPGVSSTEKAIHLMHLSDRSTINLGWPAGQYRNVEIIEEVPQTTILVKADSRYAPWEYTNQILDLLIANDPQNEGGYRFNPHDGGRGVLSFGGEVVCLDGAGRYSASGILYPANNELIPRGVHDGGGILYVNFGGELGASNSNDMILNTVIGRRTSAINAAGGLISVDSDQLIFQPRGKIETYGFDVNANPSPSLINSSSPSIVSINVSELPTASGFEPIKGFSNPYHWPHDRSRVTTRSTESIAAPVTMPTTGMLVMSSGDAIDQAQVFGATRANPFHLHLTGDSNGFARVREFVSVASDPAILGEGPHAALFLDNGARIGLGSRSWNAQSVNAWNQLGLDKVSLFPNGNGVVDLNSDLIITDKLPIVATENFGQAANAHQLIFYSDVPREIRLCAGSELDLSSFGRSGAFKQQIVFAGHVRLVIEPGAKIRFPSTVTGDNHANGPVLYFNDSSQCIFMSNQNSDASRHTDALSGFDKIRSKILGIGQIWLNKEAKLTIFDDAQLGIEADSKTPVTDVTISLQRQSRMLIGDESRSGGAFQIGNVVDGGGDGTNARTVNGAVLTNISFTLKLNGEKANFHIDRSGFFGMAAGVVNKVENPNGTIPSKTTTTNLDSYNPWSVQTLRNVKNITINIARGYFDHNQIYDGSSSSSYGSVLALGPIDYNTDAPLDALNGGRYTFILGSSDGAYVRGGGNIVFVDAGIPQSDALPLSIWDTSADITLNGSNSGLYTIMAPSIMIRTYVDPLGSEVINDADFLTANKATYSFQSRTVSTTETQGGALYEMYSIFGMPIYGGYPAKYVNAGKSLSGVTAAYLINNTIIRTPVTVAKNDVGNTVSPAGSLDKGYFVGTSPIGGAVDGAPETLFIP